MPEHFYIERLVLAKSSGGVRRASVTQPEADNSAGQRLHKCKADLPAGQCIRSAEGCPLPLLSVEGAPRNQTALKQCVLH